MLKHTDKEEANNFKLVCILIVNHDIVQLISSCTGNITTTVRMFLQM